jgi:hypothetical protein
MRESADIYAEVANHKKPGGTREFSDNNLLLISRLL